MVTGENTASCRKLERLAHSMGVSGFVRKKKHAGAGPGKGCKFGFMLVTGHDNLDLGFSRSSAFETFTKIVKGRTQ